MPTIPDDLQAAAGTEESESEREGGPKKLFSVGQLETEEETEDDNHHRYTCQDHDLDFTEFFAFLWTFYYDFLLLCRQDSYPRRKHKRKHKNKSQFTEDELNLRRAKGSELANTEPQAQVDKDENLAEKDYEDIGHNRFDEHHTRHMIASRGKRSSHDFRISGK